MRLQVPASEIDSYLNDLVKNIAEKWEKYKEDFFVRDDPEGVLKASFAICYALFVIEFLNETDERVLMYNNISSAQSKLPNLIRNSYNEKVAKLPGYNYLLGNSNGRRHMAAYVMMKKNLLSKSYNELQDGMIQAVRQKTSTIPIISNPKDIFPYTGYGPKSKFTQSFFYHSLVMFGWFMFYGWRQSSRGPVVTEFPGSCNVQGCINMYVFKGYKLLDKIVYIPHGRTMVSRTANINAMTAQRAAGTDDVQFCHHAWRLAGEAHNSESGYFGQHEVKVVRSHVDAFDVLTLTPIFRAIQRLKRTGKGDRVQYVDKLLNLVNTNIRSFVRGHLMSNLPGNTRYTSNIRNVVPVKPNASSIHFKYAKFSNDNRRYREGNMSLNNIKAKYGTNYNKFVKIRKAIGNAAVKKNSIFNKVNRNDLRKQNLSENEVNIAMRHLNTN